MMNQTKIPNDIISQSSCRSSQSTTTNTDDDQYEFINQLPSNNKTSTEIKATLSPEIISSATLLSTPPLSSPSSSDEEEPLQGKKVLNVENSNPLIIQESGHFEPVEMAVEQANLLEEASPTA
ncbi:unnamed protein product [Rotaria sp. Silwood1]|nr:unnamed protein product [Rotaria sp. Silwood1]CAF3667394.1 unnamed protein product [Rotaria sp. Silwood1]CAF3703195.1 unnamed protein product [Rotaria sp. Silwood1]CAF4823247.1 unnamed protein product [Rotaria sp. Silwood1]CAF4859958.1 unnamed protein product [Rotaria sp. Silwood1]